MTYSVYQHWDPLKICVVGRSYPPDFYSWMTNLHVRNLFEQIAQETEEDYQYLIRKLTEFGVQVVRPDLPAPEDCLVNGKYLPPPMTPRDYMVMVGDTFYENYSVDLQSMYKDIKDPSWPDYNSKFELSELPTHVQQELNEMHHYGQIKRFYSSYDNIFNLVQQQGNVLRKHFYRSAIINGAQISRIGKDLYFGTENYSEDTAKYQHIINQEFINTRNHVVNTGGHSDSTYCPVCPGLIISLNDVPTYADTFPGWEVVYLPGQSWEKVKPFLDLKQKNKGRWWIPGFEHDQSVIDTVETWLGHWVGHVEETVFDVNMLIIDPKNVIVLAYNKKVFDALDRYGITAHIVPFRHRYFWDGGIHCITSDLHRDGGMQDFFSKTS